MTHPTVRVTVNLALITGAPCANVKVHARLNKDDSYVAGTYGGTAYPGGIVVASDTTQITTADGIAIFDLFPNDPTTGIGVSGSSYSFKAQIADASGFNATAQIPNSACNLHDVMDQAVQPATVTDPVRFDTAQTLTTGQKSQARSNIGLDQVENTADADKPVSTAQQTALNLKADKTATLMAWALTQAFQIVSATRNSDEAITTASIVWPDGTTGTFTADTLSTDFPGATDAWHATYDSSPALTVTQTAVTRDSSGAVTAQPEITIS